MTRHRNSNPGLWLVTLGSVGLIISLWQPWYSFSFPGAVLDEVQQSSSQYGVLGPLINQGAEILRHLGTLHVTAWQAYTFIPAVLLVVGAVAGGLSLLMLGDRASGTAGVFAKVGMVGVAATVYRMVDRPGQSALIHIAWGLYLALGCSGAVVVGGLIAAGGESAQSPVPVITPLPDTADAAWSTANSVAPPSG